MFLFCKCKTKRGNVPRDNKTQFKLNIFASQILTDCRHKSNPEKVLLGPQLHHINFASDSSKAGFVFAPSDHSMANMKKGCQSFETNCFHVCSRETSTGSILEMDPPRSAPPLGHHQDLWMTSF